MFEGGDVNQRGKRKLKGYADLHNLAEDDRITLIGNTMMQNNYTVGVCVDDVPGKPERYIEKLKKKFPGIEVVDQMKGPTPGIVTIKLRPIQMDRN